MAGRSKKRKRETERERGKWKWIKRLNGEWDKLWSDGGGSREGPRRASTAWSMWKGDIDL